MGADLADLYVCRCRVLPSSRRSRVVVVPDSKPQLGYKQCRGRHQAGCPAALTAPGRGAAVTVRVRDGAWRGLPVRGVGRGLRDECSHRLWLRQVNEVAGRGLGQGGADPLGRGVLRRRRLAGDREPGVWPPGPAGGYHHRSWPGR